MDTNGHDWHRVYESKRHGQNASKNTFGHFWATLGYFGAFLTQDI